MSRKVYRNRLEVVINDYCKTHHLNKFKPNRAFFQHIGIGQKRFWQLVRNEAEMTFGEMNRLAEYFDTPLNDLHSVTVVELVPQKTATQVPDFEYITQEQVMSLLNIGRTKLWELRKDGELTEHRVGRKILLSIGDVTALVAKGKL